MTPRWPSTGVARDGILHIPVILAILLVLLLASPVAGEEGGITIVLPEDNAVVHERPVIVRGILGVDGGKTGQVWLIVHPLGVPEFWVQPETRAGRDGKWEAKAYIGRPEGRDAGQQFEIMAVANPVEGIKEGDVFEEWPPSDYRSQIITVTKR